jgi:hypothetical protein
MGRWVQSLPSLFRLDIWRAISSLKAFCLAMPTNEELHEREVMIINYNQR